jgi:GGDEF domain-containing protein
LAARREVSELRDLAMRDALTGLPNRRHFEMSMASRIAELAGYGRRFGLLIADIDRFGGEEFALTITDVDEPDLRALAERFRALVERSPVRTGELDLVVTISLGGTIAGIGDTAEAIFERADAALYRAREGGRNRVRLAGDWGDSGDAGDAEASTA